MYLPRLAATCCPCINPRLKYWSRRYSAAIAHVKCCRSEACAAPRSRWPQEARTHLVKAAGLVGDAIVENITILKRQLKNCVGTMGVHFLDDSFPVKGSTCVLTQIRFGMAEANPQRWPSLLPNVRSLQVVSSLLPKVEKRIRELRQRTLLS